MTLARIPQPLEVIPPFAARFAAVVLERVTEQLTPFPVARKCEAARENRYALHLLLDIDLPWNDDGTRHNRHVREVHFTRIREALEQRGWPYEIFHGSGAARQSSAFEIIRRL